MADTKFGNTEFPMDRLIELELLCTEIPEWLIESSIELIDAEELIAANDRTDWILGMGPTKLIRMYRIGLDLYLVRSGTNYPEYGTLIDRTENVTFLMIPELAKKILDELYEKGNRTQVMTYEQPKNLEEGIKDVFETVLEPTVASLEHDLRMVTNSLKMTEHLNAMLNNEMSRYRALVNQIQSDSSEMCITEMILNFKKEEEVRTREAFEEMNKFSMQVYSGSD